MNKLQSFVEFKAFGVCSKLGEKLGISVGSIRLFFIYVSFLTFGSPIFIYLVLAWIMNLRQHVRQYNQLIRGI